MAESIVVDFPTLLQTNLYLKPSVFFYIELFAHPSSAPFSGAPFPLKGRREMYLDTTRY